MNNPKQNAAATNRALSAVVELHKEFYTSLYKSHVDYPSVKARSWARSETKKSFREDFDRLRVQELYNMDLKPRRKIPKEDIEKLAIEYTLNPDITYKTLAKRYGVNQTAIHKAFQQHHPWAIGKQCNGRDGSGESLDSPFRSLSNDERFLADVNLTEWDDPTADEVFASIEVLKRLQYLATKKR